MWRSVWVGSVVLVMTGCSDGIATSPFPGVRYDLVDVSGNALPFALQVGTDYSSGEAVKFVSVLEESQLLLGAGRQGWLATRGHQTINGRRSSRNSSGLVWWVVEGDTAISLCDESEDIVADCYHGVWSDSGFVLTPDRTNGYDRSYRYHYVRR